MDLYKYQNWTNIYKYNNLNTYERNLRMINLKGEVALFREKYSEFLNTCIIKGMVEIYDIMHITCQNLYHMPYQPSTYITPLAGDPWGEIGLSVQILKCDIQYISQLISDHVPCINHRYPICGPSFFYFFIHHFCVTLSL